MLVGDARLDVVGTFHVGDGSSGACVREEAELRNGFPLKVGWGEIGKGIVAGIIVILIVPHECAECKYRIRIDQMVPRWSDVEGSDLRALVGGANFLETCGAHTV